jgi:hypothetical protein
MDGGVTYFPIFPHHLHASPSEFHLKSCKQIVDNHKWHPSSIFKKVKYPEKGMFLELFEFYHLIKIPIIIFNIFL